MRATEEMVTAWIDGELHELDANRVREALGSDPALSKFCKEQMQLKQRLAEHFDPVAASEVPERFKAMLTHNVMALGASPPVRSHSSAWRGLTAVAATVALGVLAIQLVPGNPEQVPFVPQGSELALALDEQLASTQPGDAGVRIGVTFAADDARICRTFETAERAGLACRGDRARKGWQVIATVPNAPSHGTYAQAGSGTALVMEQAQSMMKGEPFDAEMEKRARDLGWVLNR